MLQIGRSLVRSQLVSLEFFIHIKSFRSHCGPGVDTTSNRNEYQEYFLWGKCSRCVRLTILPPSCAVVTKSGNLNFLEPSGPIQACNGTALPFNSTKLRWLISVVLTHLVITEGELAGTDYLVIGFCNARSRRIWSQNKINTEYQA